MRFEFITVRRLARFQGVTVLVAAFLPAIGHTEALEAEEWNAKFQSTYVWQDKRPFSAAYSGPNSLTTDKERSYSFTATAMLGWRPWVGGW